MNSPDYSSHLDLLRYHIGNCSAMTPLLDAFDRGTKPQKLRLLAVTCSADHILAEVFPTSEGAHVVWSTGGLWGEVDERVFRTRTSLLFASPINDVPELTLRCRCGDQAPILSSAWRPWLDSKQKRVAHDA